MASTSAKTRPTATSDATAATFRSEHQRDVVNRLKRIEGQVRGLQKLLACARRFQAFPL